MPINLGLSITGIQAAQFDPDALAFISAATITDTTQRYAINNLVVGLKLNSLWGKMQAIYPFAGTTATTQKWNLKDPRDLDAAYRLTFVGGVTHSSDGFQPNGTNGYANTHFNPSTEVALTTSVSLGIYVNLVGAGTRAYDLGVGADAVVDYLGMVAQRTSGSIGLADFGTFPAGRVETAALPNALGTSIGSITSSTDRGFFRNGVRIASKLTASTPSYANGIIPLGAFNIIDGVFAGIAQFINNRYGFFFIGTGLTDAESLTFTSLVQRYQNALSRAIVAVPTVQDLDAQNFLVAASITDATQAQAVQNLTAGLKFYSLWNKMQAVYPFVGGSASPHKFNLKSPFDTNAAFRLVFNGGWTHSSTGALPNGTNAYAETYYSPTGNGNQNSNHLSYYSRTSSLTVDRAEFGSFTGTTPAVWTLLEAQVTATLARAQMNSSDFANLNTGTSTNSAAFFLGNRTGSAVMNLWKNAVRLYNVTNASGVNAVQLYLAARNQNGGGASNFSVRECALASLGGGLTDTEVDDFNTVVQAYQTALSRNV